MTERLTGKDLHTFYFHIQTEGILEIWILMDIQSTINIILNGYLLSNIIEGDCCIIYQGKSGV